MVSPRGLVACLTVALISVGMGSGAARSNQPALSRGSTIILHEGFAGGTSQMEWHAFPDFSPDPLRPVPRADAPGGGGWAGLVTNKTLGGFASLSYAGLEDLEDYSVDAWVFVDVVSSAVGPLQGLAIRVDPQARRFYRLAARFTADPSLTLAYVGRDVNNFPVFLREWKAAEIPGGVPPAGGWHRMKVRAVGAQFWAYWDGTLLPGMPVSDDRIRGGYFGVYATFVGGRQLAQTFVDDLIVMREGAGTR